jgi:hypothetical protein
MANEIFDRKNYDKLRRKVNRANKAIARIEKQYGEDSWGVNRLYNKLDNEVYKGITKGGRIRLNKSMSDVQLHAIEKMTNNFLDHKATSTLKGIKNTIKEVKSSLKATLGGIGNEISDREINKLYDLVQDKDKRDTTESIGASTIWSTLVEAKDTFKSGIESADDYINLVMKRTKAKLSEEDKDFLEEIYLKYFNKM